MGGSGYTTSKDALDRAAGQMLQTNEQLMKALQQMASELEPLQSAWQGQASTAFQHLINHFQEDAKTMNQALDTIANNVSSNAKLYAQQEEEQAQQMSSIMNTLGGA
jgi:WXG100 family type VII secretion target